MPLQLLAVIIGISAVVLLGIIIMISRFYRKVDQGHALIINKVRNVEVTFTGGVVLPVFHRAEVMDISVKTIEINRSGGQQDGLICADNIRADIVVAFFIRVNKTVDDVLRVAQSIGCDRASHQETLEKLFAAKFSEALKSVGKLLEFEQLYTQREHFKDQIIQVIGKDLNGYVLEDAAIDYLEQTKLDQMDPQNVLDAQGIRKITDITTKANVKTNELKQKERMDIGAQDLQADEAIYRFDQQRADAAAKKDKEIVMSQSREGNEALRVKLEEEKSSKVKQQKMEEEVHLANEAKLRAVAVAEQNRLREVGVEQVRVDKARDLEQVDRQREVALRDIDKEKKVEVEKKEIANIIAGRIAVEKGVATEEESIKDLRANAGAKRDKDVRVIGAEASAQEVLIKDIKKAEAEEEVAKAHARKSLTLAEADLEVSDKAARAKIRLSEGVQAEEAASGLATVRVREADAVAVEKQGLAQVKVREAGVVITEREGMVAAQIIKEKLLAEASGKEADAAATEKMGVAEAVGIRERLLAEVTAKEAEAAAIEKTMLAEATGLTEKAKAMNALEGETREHEEFRIKIEKELELKLQSLKAQVEMAKQQAEVLGAAMQNAKFNIVGGDGEFFSRFVKAVAVGHSIDGVVDNSSVLRGALGDRLNGDGQLIEDLKDIVGNASASSETIKNLTVSAALGQLMVGADAKTKGKISTLIEKAKELGLDTGITK